MTATADSSTPPQDAGLDAGNDRYHFAAAWADYDGDGWPDLLVANDFGTKNLYHNLGRRDGTVRFEDVAASAGVLDHGAGMSATFLDYDNDGLLDIYTGNMWSAPGLRVTSAPTFMRDATPEVRALYRRHVRGQFAVPKSRRWTLRGQDARGARRDGPLGVVVGRARFRQRRLGRSLHRQRHADAQDGRRRRRRPRGILLAAGRGPLTAHARARHAVRRCVACDQPAADSRLDRQPATQRVPAQRRTWRLRRDLRDGRPRPRSGRPIVCGPRHRRRRRSGPRRDGRSTGAAASDLPKRFRDDSRRRSPCACAAPRATATRSAPA